MFPPADISEAIVQLRAEHSLLESQIEALNRRLWLSTREQMERKHLQKLKLATRDRIFSLDPR